MNIGIIGGGVEGSALAQYFLKKKNAQITIHDKNVDIKKMTGVKYVTGPGYLKELGQYDVVFRSPGIPYTLPEFKKLGEKLTSQIAYFLEHCPAKVVGITGTKGKGTTATLLKHMLEGGTSRIFLGGNIGIAPIEFLDELKMDDIVILELSSFQLQDLKQSPYLAIVLGITNDHMDQHKDRDEYVAAKKNIVKFQKKGDVAILDGDNETSASFKKDTKARVLKFSTQKTGGVEAMVKVGSLLLKDGTKGLMIGKSGETGLTGKHNEKNILAAALAAHILGAPIERIAAAVRECKGLPHRLEFVKEVDAVRYYDDSASTTPDACAAAVVAFETPVILIAGGSEKQADFSELGAKIALQKNVKAVVLMGETKEKLSSSIEMSVARNESLGVHVRQTPLELISADSYQEAFMVSKFLAQPGDTVVLSPACASFDMFKNYKERGELFQAFVKEL